METVALACGTQDDMSLQGEAGDLGVIIVLHRVDVGDRRIRMVSDTWEEVV